MTLSDIKSLSCATITCQQAAAVLGMHYSTLHRQAVQDKSKLGFPVIVAGSRVYISRQGFINFVEGKVYDVPGLSEQETVLPQC